MIMLVEERSLTQMRLRVAVWQIRRKYGPENVVFDLEEKPNLPPALMAYYIKDGVTTLIGPVSANPIP